FKQGRRMSPKNVVQEEQKRSLVRALGHRIMYGISRASTVTPHALLSAALLSHRRRAIGATELANYIGLLRRIAEDEGMALSASLKNAPSDPTVIGPFQDAMRTFSADGMVRMEEARTEVVFCAADERRTELSFYKNTLMNLVVPRALVANALLSVMPSAPFAQVKERALWLSRLFKVEFIYRVGASFDAIFSETVEKLVRVGLVIREAERLSVAPEKHS